ncbi:peroxiredoxin [Dysgonomonas sp. ZJ709]|uniref:peroxiredoxin family protein n=1 Tax=Dysgonomonas sp. ZJ709 TaxID=2709797 RepID=UPI0013E9BBD7|nr:thioredoxin-like domain-containing protein [Dysgonomonas sp. ZJ709]
MPKGDKYICKIIFFILMPLLLVSCLENRQSALDKRYELLVSGTSQQKAVERTYVCDSLDFDSLYASPLWASYLHAWSGSYKEEFSGDSYTTALTDASKKLIVRVAENYPQRLKPLIRALADCLVAEGNEKAAASIAAYPYGIDVSPNEYSEIANRLLIQTRLTGNKAPAITGLDIDLYPALVIFYESDCPNCVNLLEAVKKHFNLLQDKQIRVISLSSDTDRKVFESFASQCPWTDKLCDLQGFSSPDFKHWGVAATPSLYYIDEKGIVNEPYEMEEFKFLKH